MCFAIWLFAAAVVLAAAAPARADIVGRASVIDGDTIEIHGQRVRLHVIRFPVRRGAGAASWWE
jgi:endonuclease YncB( thermonuclease family)